MVYIEKTPKLKMRLTMESLNEEDLPPEPGDPVGDPEITLTWGSLTIVFSKPSSPTSPGYYYSTHPDVHCSLYYNESGGSQTYKIENNGYVVCWKR